VDSVARGIAEPMARLLKQPVVIENVSGAAGTIGVARAAKAGSDGYTLVVGHSGTHAFNAALYPALPYKPVEDFSPIAMLATMPSVLSVPASSKFKSVGDLIEFARANPGRLNFGSAGSGSASHLATMMLIDSARIEVAFVPYRGSAPAFTDLMAGQIDALFDTSVQAIPMGLGGRVLPLGVTSSRRLSAMPKVPTFEETCCRNLSLEIWYGLFAPKGTPEPVLRILESAAISSIADSRYRENMHRANVNIPDARQASGAQLEATMRRDMVRFADVARRTNTKAE